MSRGLSAPLLAHLTSDHIVLVAMVKLEYDSGTQLYHTGVGNVVYDSGTGNETYTGVGNFGSVEPIMEELGIKMSGIRIALEGVNTVNVNLVVSEQIQGRNATVFIGAYDYELANIIDAFEIFSGYMDVSEIVRGEVGSMSLSIESIFSQFDLPNIRRYTNEDHQERFPGDLFFDQVADVAESEIIWGPHTPLSSGGGGPGRDERLILPPPNLRDRE